MKIDVRQLYEDTKYGWDDYQPMLNAYGKIAIQIDDDDYSGDSRLLYDENGKIGFLRFGWGSCSGCDALQACKTLDNVQELCDWLQNEIKWFDDRKQALEWFTNHDWEGDYDVNHPNTKAFVEKCIEYLSEPNIIKNKEINIHDYYDDKINQGINNMIDKIIIEREKSLNRAIFGEIQKIATENGVETRVVLNEQAIINAFEKQTAKKPTPHGTYKGICPNCLSVEDTSANYCRCCGQKLDWESVEGLTKEENKNDE